MNFHAVHKERECNNAKKEFEFVQGAFSWAGVWQESVKEKEIVVGKRDHSKQKLFFVLCCGVWRWI